MYRTGVHCSSPNVLGGGPTPLSLELGLHHTAQQYTPQPLLFFPQASTAATAAADIFHQDDLSQPPQHPHVASSVPTGSASGTGAGSGALSPGGPTHQWGAQIPPAVGGGRDNGFPPHRPPAQQQQQQQGLPPPAWEQPAPLPPQPLQQQQGAGGPVVGGAYHTSYQQQQQQQHYPAGGGYYPQLYGGQQGTTGTMGGGGGGGFMLPLALGLQMKPMRETKRRKGENRAEVGTKGAPLPNFLPLTPQRSSLETRVPTTFSCVTRSSASRWLGT